MEAQKFSRRTAFRLLLLPGVSFLLQACGESPKPAASDPCRDMSGIPDEDLTRRKKLGYVDQSPIEESTCSTCNLYLSPNESRKCGGCMLFKGPVESKGYCTYWAAKQEAG